MEAGPEIPPHILARRKRKAEGVAAALAAAEAVAAIGASLPEQADREQAEKRPRVIGPAPPPAPLGENPKSSATEEEEESSDDEGIGPALPSGLSPEEEEIAARQRLARYEVSKPAGKSGDAKIERDSWMLVPPKEGDWTARVDPTKIRARKFQTGRGSKAPTRSGGDTTLWTETPAEKQKRLVDEVMGLKKPATEVTSNDKPRVNNAESEETARRIKQYNEKYRSSSLYEQHGKKTDKKEEDDPSKRAWDKEKDFALGRKVTHAQKKELLYRAAKFGDRFSSGSYL